MLTKEDSSELRALINLSSDESIKKEVIGNVDGSIKGFRVRPYQNKDHMDMIALVMDFPAGKAITGCFSLQSLI